MLIIVSEVEFDWIISQYIRSDINDMVVWNVSRDGRFSRNGELDQLGGGGLVNVCWSITGSFNEDWRLDIGYQTCRRIVE